MDTKTIQENFSGRLTGLRKSLNYSREQMAAYFMVNRGTYRKYELGLLMPGLTSLYEVAVKLGVSIDWLVCGRGPVYFNEIQEKLKKQKVHETNSPEITNLLDHMNRIPFFCNEILSYFYKLKAGESGDRQKIEKSS